MYCPDVVGLKQFYASALGMLVRGVLSQRIARHWPRAQNEATLGLGFAIPFLPEQDTLAVSAMPAAQGALYWPSLGKNRVTLLHDDALPFSDNSFNRVLLVHALESTEHAATLMREVGRVLVPGGRVMAIVPNRLGIWCHSSASPFGHGQPFSAGQMRELFLRGGLTALRTDTALFLPPSQGRFMLALAPYVEALGRLIAPMVGGVLMVEAEKQIYAALREPVRARGTVAMTPIPVPSLSPRSR